MTTILEDGPMIDDTIYGDDWAWIDPATLHEENRRMLQRAIEDFINSGKRIEEIPQGVSAHAGVTSWASAIHAEVPLASRGAAPASAAKRAYSASVRWKSAPAKDAKNIEQIAALLDTVTMVTHLAKAIGRSPQKTSQLLRANFADDPRARLMVEKTWGDYRAGVVALVKEALDAGVKGITLVAERVGVSYSYLTRLDRELKLGIPKLQGGAGARRIATCRNPACAEKIMHNCNHCKHCGHVTETGMGLNRK